MKHLILTIVCACMSLAVMAGVSKPDAAQTMRASKKSCVASQSANGKKAGQSLHQFLRERNLTLNDNRLTKKAPRRSLTDSSSGGLIAVMEAQALEDFDWDGNVTLSDTVYSLGWSSNLYYVDGDDEYEVYAIDNFYGKYLVPFGYNVETGGIELFSCWIDHDSVSSGGGRNRTDTITDTYFFTVDDFFFFSEGEAINGELFNDGSMWFDGGVLIYKEIIVNVYRNTVLRSTDTLATVSPILSGLYLLNPNGIHESVVQETQSSSFDPFHFVVNASVNDMQRAYWDVERVGYVPVGPGGSGGGTARPCGGGGLKDRPIGPRNPNSKSPIHVQPQGDLGCITVDSVPVDSNVVDLMNDESQSEGKFMMNKRWLDEELGGGGHQPKPIIRPHNMTDNSPDQRYTLAPVGSNHFSNDGAFYKALKSGLVHLRSIDLLTIEPTLEPMGGGGHRDGPIRPRSGVGSGTQFNLTPPNGFIGKATTKDGVTTYTMQAPVYMFQVDDSTLFVYNLFGLGSTMNGMFFSQDGTMTLPGQALFYDPVLDDDFCNYSVVGDSLLLGNTGVVTPDTISWETTVPHGLNNAFSSNYFNNRLYFIDGSQFFVPGSFARGDVNKDGNVSITDVTALIGLLLSSECDNLGIFGRVVIDCNQDDDISITDVTTLINYLLSGVWPK